MGKIGDLWVRLGLRNEEFKKGLDDASRDTENFGNKLGGLKAGAVAVWAAIGAAVAKFAGDFLTMTQKIGDQWNVAMAGIKAGYNQFVATISSGDGWRNLFSNMAEATRLAKEAAKALDEVFERNTSYSYQEAEAKKQIALQRQIMMDASKSDAERKAAAQEIIRLEKELGKTKQDIANQEANAQRMNFKAQTLMNDEEIDFLVKSYNANRDIINQARAYNESRSGAKKGIGWGTIANSLSETGNVIDTSAKREALNKLEAETSDDVKRIAAMISKYDKSNDALVAAMAKAEVNAINVETETINSSLRANTFLGRQGGGGAALSGGNVDDLLFSLGLSGLSQVYDYVDRLEDVPPLELEPIKLKPLDKTSVEAFIGSVEDMERKIAEIGEAFNDAIVTGFSDGIQTLMDGMMGLENLNGGAILQALLEPLADLAIRQGEITMASGMATTAIGKSLAAMDGTAAIAAGAALIAVGSAAKAGLASLASSMGGGASASSATTATNTMANSVTSEEIVVRVEGKISGNDILISGQRTSNQWNR